MAERVLGLVNGGFEEGFRHVGNVGELNVAVGWEPWWDPKAARPEYKDAAIGVDARRVKTGSHAQQWFNNYNKHTAGILQVVGGVTPGKTLQLVAWVQCFSSGKDDFSKSDGRYRMRIGVDPYGGVDPESTDVVWSDEGNAVQPYDAYARLEVETVARSDRCTVLVWGQAEWPLKHNDAYVDDVVLVEVDGEPGPEPGPDDERVDVLVSALRVAIGRMVETLEWLRDAVETLKR